MNVSNDNRDKVVSNEVDGLVEDVIAPVKLPREKRGDSVSDASPGILNKNVLQAASHPVLRPPVNTVSASDRSHFNFNSFNTSNSEVKPEVVLKKFFETEAEQGRLQDIARGEKEAVKDGDLNKLAAKTGVSVGELAVAIGKPAKELLSKVFDSEKLTAGDAKQLKLAIAFPGSTNLSPELNRVVSQLKACTDNAAANLANKYGFSFSEDWDGSAYFNKALYQNELSDNYDFAFEQALNAAAKDKNAPLTKDQVVRLNSMHYALPGVVPDPELEPLLAQLNGKAAEQVRGAYNALPGFTPPANQQFFAYVVNGGFVDAFRTAIGTEVAIDDADMYLANLADPANPSVSPKIKKILDGCFEVAQKFAVDNFGLEPAWKPAVTSFSPPGFDPRAYAAAKARCDIADHHIKTLSAALEKQPPSPAKEQVLSMMMVYAMAMSAARQSLWASNMVGANMAEDVCKSRAANNEALAKELQKAQEDMQKPAFWQKFTKALTTIGIAAAACAVSCLLPMTAPLLAATVVLVMGMAVVDVSGSFLEPPRDFIKEGMGEITKAIQDRIGTDTGDKRAIGNLLSFLAAAAICVVVAGINSQAAISLLTKSGGVECAFRMCGAGDDVTMYGSMAFGMALTIASLGKQFMSGAKNVDQLSKMAQTARTAANITQTGATLVQSGVNIYTSVIEQGNIQLQKGADLAQITAEAAEQMLKILGLLLTKNMKDMAQLASALGENQSEVMQSIRNLRFGKA